MSLLLCSACILRFDVDPNQGREADNLLVIDGLLSNSPTERLIRVNWQDGRGTITSPFAEGSIFKDGQMWATLDPDTLGLVLPEEFLFEEGASYHLEIIVDDSLEYHSQPQVIYPSLQTDSLSFEVDRQLVRNSANVNVLREFVLISAHVTLAASSDKKEYYYWNVDEAWSFTEITDPRVPGDIPRTCYPRGSISQFPATLLSNDQVLTGPTEILIASRFIDESFLEKHYFTAYLRAIDPATFIYFKNATSLGENAGSLFEQFPGTIKGNLFNPNDDNELVMGNVAFSLVDTLHFSVSNFELKARIFDVCTAENVFSNPIRCFDCTYAFGAESLIKPDYWE